MPRPIKCIEIYLPLDYNDGEPIEEVKFLALQAQLLAKFGGVTSTKRDFPLQGIWRRQEEVFQDRVVIFAAMDFHPGTDFQSLNYLVRLKAQLKKKFRQIDVLITVQDLLAI